MKSSFSLTFLFFLALISVPSLAQETVQEKQGKCFSDQYMQHLVKNNGFWLAGIEKSNRLLNNEISKKISRRTLNRNLAESSLPIIIPVVVHIVLTDPAQVSDLEVKQQIDKLNLDFSGLNADSTNLYPMFPYRLRGHSNIQFALAGKDPHQNFTTGIERRCSSTKFNGEENDDIKRSAAGGLDAWDATKYVNIWVGNSNLTGTLAYSSYPYSIAGYNKPPMEYFGICIKRGAFGNSTSPYAFNRGRTLVHEMGHYFGLFHTFQGGCADEDFSLGAFDSTNTDDTPPQSSATGTGAAASCPSGNISSGCTGSPDGRLYQDYMDYTDDPCMSMFTVNQVLRMETALDLFLPGLRSSDAATPPGIKNRDIEVLASLNPYAGGESYFGCDVKPVTNFCTDLELFTITPSLIIRNAGTDVLANLEVWYSIDENPAILNRMVTLTGALNYLDTASILLNDITIANGQHRIQIFTKLAGSLADEKTANDSITLDLIIHSPTGIPVDESFETAFPPEGWNLSNQGNDNLTWQKADTVGKSGKSSVFMNFFEYDRPGSIDDLVTPTVSITNADSILLEFERAYMQFDTTVKDFSDTLEILVVEDCGAITRSIWKKGGAELATEAGQTGFINWMPDSLSWQKARLELRNFVSAGAHTLQVIFRGKNGYGQNLFLDDIKLSSSFKPIKDVTAKKILEPFQTVCGRNFTPSCIIQNLGEDTLRSLDISFQVDGGNFITLKWKGSLRKFFTDTVKFSPLQMTNWGKHDIRFVTSMPNGLRDENAYNDTLSASFFTINQVMIPSKEGFESANFPPAGWGLGKTEGSESWNKTITASTENLSSAVIRNRLNQHAGAIGELVSPVYTLSNPDSIVLKFDLSHVTEVYPGSAGLPTDTLEILLTKDCGKSFVTVYKKWGAALNTLNQAYPGYSTRDSAGFTPINNSEWRTDAVNITREAGTNGSFQLIFRNINNNDNNLFLDNIRVNPVILPPALKSRGYQLIPNPTTGLFYIRFYKPPMNLAAIQVVNGNGQVILQKDFQSNAPVSIPVDLSAYAAGVYTVRMKYGNDLITERIIKVK